METTTNPIFPLDIEHVLANSSQCVVCHRSVSAKTIDAGKAVMVPVTADGLRIDHTPTREDMPFYKVVVGPECKGRI